MARRKPEETKSTPALSAVAKRFGAFKPAPEVLRTVRSVRTRFIQYDWATRVGGHPIERSTIVHGPSNEGKTLFLIGLEGSFVEQGHFAQHGDAERTTTKEWVDELLGEGFCDRNRERFYASRPDSYEAFVDEVREFHQAVKASREAGEVPENTTAITVVDSLRKLVPEDIMKKILKEGASGEKGSVDGMGGRAAQIRAAMNAAWMDELVPLLDRCGTSFVAIARESEDPNADMWAKKFGNDYKVGGGKAVIYDAALVLRIQRDGWIKLGEGEKAEIIGERHKITIRKTKVGGKEGRVTVAYFHTSNGKSSPEGFDPTRDVIELALKLGVLKQENSRYTWPSRSAKPFANGRENLVIGLREAEDDRKILEEECRSAFSAVAPEEETETEEGEA
jgi:RecA/RadA recombinase